MTSLFNSDYYKETQISDTLVKREYHHFYMSDHYTFWVGDIAYFRKSTNQFHNEDGPALERADGSKVWYLNGKQIMFYYFISKKSCFDILNHCDKHKKFFVFKNIYILNKNKI